MTRLDRKILERYINSDLCSISSYNDVKNREELLLSIYNSYGFSKYMLHVSLQRLFKSIKDSFKIQGA